MAFPKDAVFKVVTTVHRVAFDLSKGRALGKAAGMPVVKLTTVGRKSGQRRSTMLTAPLIEGENVILVASFGGDDRNPTWFGNLVANPDVEVEMGSDRFSARAVVLEGEERGRVWEQAASRFPFLNEHQSRTPRQIPVIALERS